MNQTTHIRFIKKQLFTLLFCLLAATTAQAQNTVRKIQVPLGNEGAQLFGYLPEKPTGRAVICCPGGAYESLAIDHEGHQWSAFFNPRGIAFFVLKYRMPRTNHIIPLTDAEAAMRLVRDSAAAWHINPADVGIMGFSAGGHVASTLSTHASAATRPNFAILFYPVITMKQPGTHLGSRHHLLGDKPDRKLVERYCNELQVRSGETPTTVLFLTADDDVVPPIENGVAYYCAMQRAGNACTLHIYPTGGHGFGYLSSWRYHNNALYELNDWLTRLPAPTR